MLLKMKVIVTVMVMEKKRENDRIRKESTATGYKLLDVQEG